MHSGHGKGSRGAILHCLLWDSKGRNHFPHTYTIDFAKAWGEMKKDRGSFAKKSREPTAVLEFWEPLIGRLRVHPSTIHKEQRGRKKFQICVDQTSDTIFRGGTKDDEWEAPHFVGGYGPDHVKALCRRSNPATPRKIDMGRRAPQMVGSVGNGVGSRPWRQSRFQTPRVASLLTVPSSSKLRFRVRPPL